MQELHVFDRSLRAVYHRDAVAGRYGRVGRRMVNIADPAGGHDRYFGQHRIDFMLFQIQHVSAEAGDVRRAFFDQLAQVVLRQDVDREMMLVDFDVVVALDAAHQRAFDLVAGDVFVVQDAVLAVPSFAGQFVASRAVLVEFRAPVDQLFDDRRRMRHDLFDRRPVANARAAHQRVVDVFLERVGIVHYRCDAALRVIRVAFAELAFGDDHYLSVFGGFQREAESGDTAADDQKIRFYIHCKISF